MKLNFTFMVLGVILVSAGGSLEHINLLASTVVGFIGGVLVGIAVMRGRN